MWRRIANWYREWEDEQLAVLKEPSLAAQAPAGYRRYVANMLATLSQHERDELHAFSLAYRGSRILPAIGKLAVAFSLCGVVLHLALPAKFGWLAAIVLANVVGAGIAMTAIGSWFNYAKFADRKFTAAVRMAIWTLLGALIGLGIGFVTSPTAAAKVLEELPFVLAEAFLFVGAVVLVPAIGISMLRKRQYQKLTAELQREAERERLARQLSESQLRLLRAQIEPHFLFNTLGAVQQLAEQGAPRAAELTANLIAFLRASLDEMRSDEAVLSAEFRLVDAYLRVMQARLGERLRFSLTLPAALAQNTVPSMMLLTLVENSIKHGIEPALHGGTVQVSAEAIDGMVRLRVQDSGVGMSVTPGAGLGLENVRHRLLLAYPGSASSLTLHEAEPGLVADILIPTERAPQ